PDRTIESDDIVFADFGPVFDGWEADLGRTWVLGDDPVKQRLRDDLQPVFDAGKEYFASEPNITGEQLYTFVATLANERGWEFGNFHCGHLVDKYPHERLDGEKHESMIMAGNTLPMRRVDTSGNDGHWILEIHLVDRERAIGGFYEQLLT